METESTYDALSRGHDAMVRDLVALVESGEASANDKKLLLDLIKNSNISAIPTQGNVLGKLAGKLDFSAMADKVVPLQKFTEPGPVPRVRRPSAG